MYTRVYQLCPDQPSCLSPLRSAPAREEQKSGEVLCGKRRLHLCPASGKWRQLGCHQSEADFCERWSRLGGGRRSWRLQPQLLDCYPKRGESSFCQDQLDDIKNLPTTIVIPTIVPETWYEVSSLFSEFGKMSNSCRPYNSKNPKLVSFSFHFFDVGKSGQAYYVGMGMGAKDND